ncbi:MAG: hypothetical protein WD995_09940 [Gemmatimonadota bacterium]
MTDATADPSVEATKSRPTADFLYETFYGGAIGGSILALFFLIVDALARQPLFTPSLIGTVLFTDAAASATVEVQLDMIAYFSVVHLATFLLTGAAMSWLYRWLNPDSRRPVVLAAVLFALLTGSFALFGLTMAPGLLSELGLAWIALGNLLTAIGMIVFLEKVHVDGDKTTKTGHR